MLTSIGRKRPSEDLVELLLECHGRIRSFTQLALRLSESDALPAEEVVDAARRIASYFGQALPLHARDEEESLVPRLRGLDPELDDALAQMCEEHEEHRPALAELLALCSALQDDPSRHAELAPTLNEVAGELREQFDEHLENEETRVFPELQARLDATTKAQIVDELRARRRDTAGHS